MQAEEFNAKIRQQTMVSTRTSYRKHIKTFHDFEEIPNK